MSERERETIEPNLILTLNGGDCFCFKVRGQSGIRIRFPNAYRYVDLSVGELRALIKLHEQGERFEANGGSTS